MPEVVVGGTRLRDVGIDLRRVTGHITVIAAGDTLWCARAKGCFGTSAGS